MARRGLADDVRHYGRWMRDEAEKRIGHLYPPVEITPEMVRERPDLEAVPRAGKLTVIAWLWARTVKSPNPAFADVDVPLASTFMLSTKQGKEAYVEPVIEGRSYRFAVRIGAPPDLEIARAGTKLARGASFRCLMSGSPISGDHIKAEGRAKRMGARLMAIVAEGDRGRVYLAPTVEHEETAERSVPEWQPELNMPRDRRWFSPPLYGLPTYGDIFTRRQLVALTTFSDLVGEATEGVRRDAVRGGGWPTTIKRCATAAPARRRMPRRLRCIWGWALASSRTPTSPRPRSAPAWPYTPATPRWRQAPEHVCRLLPCEVFGRRLAVCKGFVWSEVCDFGGVGRARTGFRNARSRMQQ